MRRHRPLELAVLLGLLLASGVAAEPLTVAVGGPAEDPAYLPVHAAAALGVFQAEGVEVTLKREKHPSGALGALRDREAGIAVTTLDEAIRGAWAREVPLTVLAVHVRAPAAALLVTPTLRDTVRRPADLRGHVVGIPGPGTTGHLLLSALLRDARLRRWDVDVRSLGGAAMAAALGRGDLAAAIVEEPWISRLLDADRAVPLLDFRAPEVTERAFGGAFYEVVSVAPAPVPPPKEKPKPGTKPGRQPLEPPPEAALVAYARAVARVQAWLATTEPAAVAERLPAALVGHRERFVARLAALRPTYAGTGEPTVAGLETSLRVLHAGSPWPVTLKLGPEDLRPPAAVTAARLALGAAPPAP